MELKDFIKGTISDIAMAIKELNNEYKEDGLKVNPKKYCGDTVGIATNNEDGRAIKDIEFNLSISATDTTEKGGGFKITVLSGGIDKGNTNTTVSIVKFSIPVVFP